MSVRSEDILEDLEKKGKNRITYTYDQIMNLKNSPLSNELPKDIDMKVLNQIAADCVGEKEDHSEPRFDTDKHRMM